MGHGVGGGLVVVCEGRVLEGLVAGGGGRGHARRGCQGVVVARRAMLGRWRRCGLGSNRWHDEVRVGDPFLWAILRSSGRSVHVRRNATDGASRLETPIDAPFRPRPRLLSLFSRRRKPFHRCHGDHVASTNDKVHVKASHGRHRCRRHGRPCVRAAALHRRVRTQARRVPSTADRRHGAKSS